MKKFIAMVALVAYSAAVYAGADCGKCPDSKKDCDKAKTEGKCPKDGQCPAGGDKETTEKDKNA